MLLDDLLRVLLRDGQAGDALELGNKTVRGELLTFRLQRVDVNKVLRLFSDAPKLHVLCRVC
jgi:hypothetical protein